ncbi:histidine phosphatase superfamily [Pyronema omphalodes]|nr:histidine phosphatase superfamily [Pyronema omphalodes]
MGKPRLIILIRHAQSVGNANRNIHQTVPDHRVPLTAHGHSQALAAGDKLASLLLPTDTLQIITSPYTRTRETTQGILSSSLQHHPAAPSIRVYEEPRIREQDFGNFQPCQAEMTRMWHERAAYGHFFYRIPNGESAADAYDRVSGFNESLWRQFAEEDFPSVLVLVTHGLMTRIFLMKWYHYSVEYFEDLRNVDHCEFIIMEKSEETGKYDLKTELRTWSGYKREMEELRYKCPPVLIAPPEPGSEDRVDPARVDPARLSRTEVQPAPTPGAPHWSERKYGGCVNGCNHGYEGFGRRLEVMAQGRDFGGSRSGAASRAPSTDGSTTDEEDLDVAGPGGVKAAKEDGGGFSAADTMENLKKQSIVNESTVGINVHPA